MSSKICSGICKKFRVKKPVDGGRYAAGQGLCNICNVWINYHGAHLKNGSPATEDSHGWVCNCCNYRVRRHPRNRVCKEKQDNYKNLNVSKNNLEKSSTMSNQNDADEAEISETNRKNDLISIALQMIKDTKRGIYLGDMKNRLNVSDHDFNYLIPRLVRIDGVTKREVMHGDIILETIFEYDNSQHEKVESNDTRSMIMQMIYKYHIYKKSVNKYHRIKLINDFIKLGSVKNVVKNNPDLSKEDIKEYTQTDLRLPVELKKLENEGALHQDVNCSLYIAVFAVNYYDWDGEKHDQDNVTNLAKLISKYLAGDKKLNKEFCNNTLTIKIANKKILGVGENYKKILGEYTTIATVVWIAIALLHKQNKHVIAFSNKEINEKINSLKFGSFNYDSVNSHISAHCVANMKKKGGIHRKLYKVERNRYRLYRLDDDCHPTRKDGPIEPPLLEIPKEFKDLIDWYRNEYCKLDN